MSFPRANIKRFNDDKGCAPPPGHYNPKHSYKLQGVSIDGVERFKDTKGAAAAGNESTVITTPVKQLFTVPQSSGSKKSSKPPSKKKDESQSGSATAKLSGKDVDELNKIWINMAGQLDLFDTLTGSLEKVVQSYATTIEALDSCQNVKKDKQPVRRELQKTDSKTDSKDSLASLNDGTVKTDMKLQICKREKECIEKRFTTALKDHSTDIDKVKTTFENRKKDLTSQMDELMKNKEDLRQKLDDLQQKYHVEQQESSKRVKQLEESSERVRQLEDREAVMSDTTRNLHERIVELQAANEDLIASLKETGELLSKNKEHNIELEEMLNASEERLEHSKKEFLTQIESLVFEKSKVEADLSEKDTRLKCLHDDFERQKCDADGQIQTLTTQLDQNQSELLQLQDKLGVLVCEKSQLHTEIGHLEAQMKLIKSTSEQTKVEAEKALEVVPELMARLEAVNLEKNAAEEHIKQLKTENLTLQKTLETSQSDYDEFVKKMEREKCDYQTQIVSQTDEIEGLKELKDEMARQLDDWLTDKSELEIEVAKLQCRIKVLEMDCEQGKLEYEEEMKKKEGEIEKIREEKTVMEKDMEQYGIDLLSNAAQLQTIQAQLNSKEKDYENLLEETDSLEEDLRSQKHMNEDLQSQIEEIRADLFKRSEERDELVKKNETKDKSLAVLSTTVSDLTSQVQTLTSTLNMKTSECEEVTQKLVEVEQNLETKCKQVSNYKQQIEDYLEHLQAKCDECEELQEKCEEQDTELSTLNTEVASLNDRLESVSSHSSFLYEKLLKVTRYGYKIAYTKPRAHEGQTSELIQQYEATIEDLRSQLNSATVSKQTEEELARYKSLYEELQQKVEPFLEQINAFELEKQTLLGMNKNTQAEMERLSTDYARLLGHQNQKQKIKHIMKIKDENSSLKNEIMQLRSQVTKQKQTIKKLEEKNAPKRFDVTKAFSHSKENVTETEKPKTPLKDANRK